MTAIQSALDWCETFVKDWEGMPEGHTKQLIGGEIIFLKHSLIPMLQMLLPYEREQMERCFDAGKDSVVQWDDTCGFLSDTDFDTFFTTQFNEK